ncbi:MAG: 2-oxo acid dehydrogenase subunit E2, partial [Mesorhizobium sp.]
GLFGKALQDGVRVTPLARRLIAEQGIDLKGLLADRRTKGVDRIAMKDVQAYAAARGATQPVLPHPAPAAPVP